MPFVFVRASKHNNYNPSKFEGTSFEWKIQAPLNLYGDTDVLEMMQMGEIKSEQDIKQYLGDHFVEKREFFVETGDFIKNLKLKYNETVIKFRRHRE